VTDPAERLTLLASNLEDQIATVFRQIAMNRFEHAMHTARREEGELSIERLGELWAETQTAMLGDSVELTPGYLTWWSYIPHFIGTPGYVYAYAYGQLLALSVYARYEEEGSGFVPRYLDLLRAGGSKSPEGLGQMVGIDLADPQFWDAASTSSSAASTPRSKPRPRRETRMTYRVISGAPAASVGRIRCIATDLELVGLWCTRPTRPGGAG
jgi:oligoendopeptidase F